MIKGLYIHMPYCSYKCPYCDFFSVTNEKDESYFDILIEELKLYQFKYDLYTIYFGGGSPSVFKPTYYKTFLKNLSKIINIETVKEITMEINPADYSYEDFKILKDIGFNRLSFGAQSFNDNTLKWLGRNHVSKDTLVSLENARRAGFDNISIDIMWGVPWQTIEDFEQDITMALSLDLEHMSFYMLTFYQNTPIYEKSKDQKDENILSEFYTFLREKIIKENYIHYEISNFAKPNYFSKHNLIYWNYEDYLGIGASAWSKIGNYLFSNPKNLTLYRHNVINKLFKPNILSEEESRKNKIMMGLRTIFGIDKTLINIPRHLSECFETTENRVFIKPEFWLLSNYIISHLI